RVRNSGKRLSVSFGVSVRRSWFDRSLRSRSPRTAFSACKPNARRRRGRQRRMRLQVRDERVAIEHTALLLGGFLQYAQPVAALGEVIVDRHTITLVRLQDHSAQTDRIRINLRAACRARIPRIFEPLRYL